MYTLYNCVFLKGLDRNLNGNKIEIYNYNLLDYILYNQHNY